MTINTIDPKTTDISKYKLRRKAEIIIRKGNKYLICLPTQDKPFHAFPGGGIDEGETPIEAAQREALEEVGVQVTNARLLPFERVFVSIDNSNRVQKWDGGHSYYIAGDFDKINISKLGSEGDAREYEFMTYEQIKIVFKLLKNNDFARVRFEILTLLHEDLLGKDTVTKTGQVRKFADILKK